jgi:hypothetical protein
MLERKEENTEKKEREKYYQRNRYASEEVERLREKEDGWQRHRQARKKGKNQRIQIQEEVWEVYLGRERERKNEERENRY